METGKSLYRGFLSVDELAQIRHCRRKWYYSTVLEYERKESNPYLYLGLWLHKHMEIFFRSLMQIPDSGYAYQKMVSQGREEADSLIKEADIGTLDSIRSQGGHIIENWIHWYGRESILKDMTPLAVEEDLAVKINGVLLTGKVDLIMEDNISKKVWIVDHKVTNRIVPIESTEMQESITAYMWMIKQMGGEVGGAINHSIARKLSETPGKLHSGKLSQKKSQRITFVAFKNAIKDLNEEHGLERDQERPEYTNFLKFLEAKGYKGYFGTESFKRSPRELDSFAEHLLTLINEVSSWVSESQLYPNPSLYSCKTCAFQPLCKGLECGEKASDYLETLYTKKVPVQLV